MDELDDMTSVQLEEWRSEPFNAKIAQQQAEIKALRAVIIRAKDALLDGQSTQWVHDVLAAALKDTKP